MSWRARSSGRGPIPWRLLSASRLPARRWGRLCRHAEYWPRIREICDRYGILLIVDEVMTGMGRTGRWFAIEEWDVTPDILCLGKGVSGGYLPLSVTAVRGAMVEVLWEKSGDFNHGGTFSHQPPPAAAGVATLDYLEKHDLITQSHGVGSYLGKRLHGAFDAHPHVGDSVAAG